MSKIKSCFGSRWENGELLEVDFSQLEVVGVALLSGDDVLKDDIRSGRDMHKERASQLFRVPVSDVTSEQRQIAKRLSFQLQYGAGAKSMAAKNGVSEEVAQRFIDLYYERYERLYQWQQDNMETVDKSRVATSRRTTRGLPSGKGMLVSPTGRMYTFFEEDAPDWMRTRKWGKPKETSFSPTQIKNYPSQGFATADVMALYRKMLLDKWRESARVGEPTFQYIPVMTIHDSVMFDCLDHHYANKALMGCKYLATKLPEEIESRWGIRCDLPFKVEGKMGKRWSEMKPVV